MNNAIDDVHKFMDAGGQTPPDGPPQLLSRPSNVLRANLLDSEVAEYHRAVETNDLVEIADALADIIYVAVGTAIAHRIPFTKVWNEVQRSNMTKVDEHGYIVVSEDGKILKPDHYEEPRIEEILNGDL